MKGRSDLNDRMQRRGTRIRPRMRGSGDGDRIHMEKGNAFFEYPKLGDC